MLDRFSDYAASVIATAKAHAIDFGHEMIGDEHILLGLAEVEDGVASKILIESGLSADSIRKKLLELIPKTPSKVDNPKFTASARRILELAYRDAVNQRNSDYVKTEHILFGICEDGGGIANTIISELGVSVNDIRVKVLAALDSNADGSNIESVLAGAMAGDKESGIQMLNKYAKDLTELARDGKIDPVIGREQEIERVIHVLSRRTKNNPVLVGDPGVGKTAIAEGLALAIVDQNVPVPMMDKKVYSLDISSMLAGAMYRGMFEDRLKKVLAEVINREDIILFIDEIHTLVGAGTGADSSLDAAAIMKPMLARGEIQTIGATTASEYSKHFEKDAALARRFQPVKVPEPTVIQAIEILKGLRNRYESHHRVIITDEAIEDAVKLSARYVSERFLPDKAIDLLDEACARLHVQLLTWPKELKDLKKEISNKRQEMEAQKNEQDYDSANITKEEVKKLEHEFQDKETAWTKKSNSNKEKVTSELIASVLEMSTGVPVQKMTESEAKRLISMEAELHKRIIGQQDAISAVSRSLRRTRAGLKDPKRPSGSFIFAGPTGVGKTELTKALAEFLFGDDSAIIQVDMSEYGERHTSSRLFGAPPGYVGYEEGGQLTEKVRRNPFSIILLDEIEKAHSEIFNTFLQVLEEGHLTDSTGRVVDFKNTIIIMTTNLGSSELARGVSVGFSDDDNASSTYERMQAKVKEDLKKNFRPEFLNRLDEVIVFNQLSQEEIIQIVDLLITSLAKRLQEKNITIEFTHDAKELLAKKGYDPLLGARPLRRVISKEIEDALSEKILYGDLKDGQKVKVHAKNKQIEFEIK